MEAYKYLVRRPEGVGYALHFDDMLRLLGELGKPENAGKCIAFDQRDFDALPEHMPSYKYRVYRDNLTGYHLLIRPNAEGSYPKMPFMKRIR